METIVKALLPQDAQDAQGWRAAPVDDLSRVWPRFTVWMLLDPDHGVLRHATRDDTRAAIERVAALYTRVVAGVDVPAAEFATATKSAAAASVDAWAAMATAAEAWAAEAAAWAAAGAAAGAEAAAAWAAARAEAAAAAWAAAGEEQLGYLVGIIV
jgi:hypothetical protein